MYERMTEESQFHGLDMTGEVPEQYIREARLIIALWEMEREGGLFPITGFLPDFRNDSCILKATGQSIISPPTLAEANIGTASKAGGMYE